MFFITKLPLFSVIVFYVFCIISAILFPGTEKDIVGFKSFNYSLTHNFLSELGGVVTHSGVKNTYSMFFFNFALILVGFTISCFYYHFKYLFVNWDDHYKSIKYSRFTSFFGLIAGFMFAGVGFVPYDVSFQLHVFFANFSFLFLFFTSIFHVTTIFCSIKIHNFHSFGYLLFCFFLLAYLYLIFLGPEISPNGNYNEKELVVQVVSQKIIVFIFTISMLMQVFVIKSILGFNNNV